MPPHSQNENEKPNQPQPRKEKELPTRPQVKPQTPREQLLSRQLRKGDREKYSEQRIDEAIVAFIEWQKRCNKWGVSEPPGFWISDWLAVNQMPEEESIEYVPSYYSPVSCSEWNG